MENKSGVDNLSNENNDQNNDEGTVSKESNDQDNDLQRGRSRKRSHRTKSSSKSSAKSRRRSVARRQESTASPPLRKKETAERNGHNVKIDEPKDATKDKDAKKTSFKQIITNSGLILTTATKRKFKNSTAYSVETRLMEYEAARGPPAKD